MAKSGLLAWGEENLSENDLESFSEGCGDVSSLPDVLDVFADNESEIESVVSALAEKSGLESWMEYVSESYASEMESGDLSEVKAFAVRCALEALLTKK